MRQSAAAGKMPTAARTAKAMQCLAQVLHRGLGPFLSQLLHGHSPVPCKADETRGFQSREAAAPAQVTSRDTGEEVRELPAAGTPAKEQVMEEEEEEVFSFLLLSSLLNKRATGSCFGNIFSDCQSGGDCSEGLCTGA